MAIPVIIAIRPFFSRARTMVPIVVLSHPNGLIGYRNLRASVCDNGSYNGCLTEDMGAVLFDQMIAHYDVILWNSFLYFNVIFRIIRYLSEY